jgi:hypothetical protein
MPIIPPAIDITGKKGNDKFQEWVNAYQKSLWAGCQDIDATAIKLHADLVEFLTREGLATPGRFGGSSASKAAGTVSSKMKRASRKLEEAITLLKGAKAACEKNVDAPVAAARAARARAKSSYDI